MKGANRGAILSELRQLVNEIDNNNYVARKLYDYCEKTPPEDSTDEDLPMELTMVDPMMMPLVPHYHMSELISTSITIVVTVIQTIREFIRNIFGCIIGSPNMRDMAIQYDNIVKPQRIVKPQKSNSKNRILPEDIGKSDLKLALGSDIYMDNSTYFMYDHRDSRTMTDITTSSTENSFDLQNLEMKCHKRSTKSSAFSSPQNSTTITEKCEETPKIELHAILSGDYEKTPPVPEREVEKMEKLSARTNITISTQPAGSTHSSARYAKQRRTTPRVIHKNYSQDNTTTVIGDVRDMRYIKSGRL